MDDFNKYQKTTETLKDNILMENRKLRRQLDEKTQSFELLKLVHFDKNITLEVLNDIIIGCTGCLYSIMFSNQDVISSLDINHPYYISIMNHADKFKSAKSLGVFDNIIENFTVVVYPVGVSDLLKSDSDQIHSIVMIYPNKVIDEEMIEFIKSFMIVNEVLINTVLTRKKMMELIELDSLTKAYNRHVWKNTINELINQDSIFFILFIDIDNFKKINDNHGHQKGDEVLIFTSNWIKSIFSNKDYVFRLGGDEFAVTGYIKDNNSSSFHKLISSLNQKYSSELSSKLDITSSISIGALITKPGISEEEIFEKVDNLLYISKSKGKNTFTVETSTLMRKNL